jgi:RNA polymerase sigma factor for flagellar operon FliA
MAVERWAEPAAVEHLWDRLKNQGDATARDELILRYMSLVRYVAGRLGMGLPSSIDPGDLIGYGVFGLIDAIEKFDLDRSVKFETYAINRIRGAIIDELRATDWIPRSVRYKARGVERAYAELEAQLQRAPTDLEVAALMDITVSELNAIVSQVANVHMVALDEQVASASDRSGSVSLVDTLEDTQADDPIARLETERTRVAIAKGVSQLPDREKLIVTLYYYEGIRLAEIGRVLGVTESRICQMHTKAVLMLRERLLVG